MLPRDPRTLVLELMRPRVREDSLELDARICRWNAADGDDAVQIVKAATQHAAVRQLLAADALADLRQRLDSVSPDEATEIVKAWQQLDCANANLVDFNEVLTACTGSNTEQSAALRWTSSRPPTKPTSTHTPWISCLACGRSWRQPGWSSCKSGGELVKLFLLVRRRRRRRRTKN